MLYRVTFSKYYEYEVEAEGESEAIDTAYREFASEMNHPSGHTIYDDVDAEELDDE